MVRITRREFLKYCSVAAGALGLSASTLMKLEKAYAKETSSGGIPVIWLDGAACTGCSVSLLNSQFYVDAKDLLINTLDLNYHKTVMTAAGAYSSNSIAGVANALTAAQNTYNFPLTTGTIARGGYVLVVEGAIPCAKPPGGVEAGDYCKVGDLTGTGEDTMLGNIHKLASRALAVVAVGTCASFGGIPGARGNATDARGCLYKGTSYGTGALLDSTVGGGGITNVLGLPIEACTINVPGCPPHPDWIVGTIAHIVSTLGDLNAFLGLVQAGVNAGMDLTLAQNALKAALPPLTNYNRPTDYGYREYQCNAGPCPWRYNNATNRAKVTDPYTNSWYNPTYPYYTSPGGSPYGPAGTNPPYALTDYTTEVDYNRRYPQGDSKRLGRTKWDDTIEGSNGNPNMGCLGILGCKGRKTKADCSRRRWNTDTAEQYGVNWCVGNRGNCHGCTEPTFPDKVGKFYTFS